MRDDPSDSTNPIDAHDELRETIEAAAEALGGHVLTDEQVAELLEAGERHTMERDDQARSEGRRFVDEETDHELIETWWAEAGRCQSIDDATMLAQRLLDDYQHDYGTICHAIGAASYAMAQAMNASPSGHITGFQAGAVQWMWLRHWNQWESEPRRLVEYNDLLYPQYDERFSTISGDTADWLMERAATNLAGSPHAHPDVITRWRDLAAGRFPAFLHVERAATDRLTTDPTEGQR